MTELKLDKPVSSGIKITIDLELLKEWLEQMESNEELLIKTSKQDLEWFIKDAIAKLKDKK